MLFSFFACIFPWIHSVKYFLSIYCIPGTAVNDGDVMGTGKAMSLLTWNYRLEWETSINLKLIISKTSDMLSMDPHGSLRLFWSGWTASVPSFLMAKHSLIVNSIFWKVPEALPLLYFHYHSLVQFYCPMPSFVTFKILISIVFYDHDFLFLYFLLFQFSY